MTCYCLVLTVIMYILELLHSFLWSGHFYEHANRSMLIIATGYVAIKTWLSQCTMHVNIFLGMYAHRGHNTHGVNCSNLWCLVRGRQKQLPTSDCGGASSIGVGVGWGDAAVLKSMKPWVSSCCQLGFPWLCNLTLSHSRSDDHKRMTAGGYQCLHTSHELLLASIFLQAVL